MINHRFLPAKFFRPEKRTADDALQQEPAMMTLVQTLPQISSAHSAETYETTNLSKEHFSECKGSPKQHTSLIDTRRFEA